ncbi:MAG: hypothetical protein IJU02_07230 [Lachnospiraceae bacterium]|nr:hypothetical protein [Lachnospiraceae bacterium]
MYYHFTKEQIDEIKSRILNAGVKDTQFFPAESLTGTEQLAIVQNGENVRISLEDVWNGIANSQTSPLFNLTHYLELRDEDNRITTISLEEALPLCPSETRRIGQCITFMSTSGDWQIWQFFGNAISDWNITSKWRRVNIDTLYEFYLSAFQTVDNFDWYMVINDEYKHIANKNIPVKVTIEVTDGHSLYLVTPKNYEYLSVTMSGVEIPLTLHHTDTSYAFMVSESLNAGTYTITINLR